MAHHHRGHDPAAHRGDDHCHRRVRPLYEPSQNYRYGSGSWSWIIAGDASTNFDTQKQYVDFSAAMGYQSVLVDALWDTQIGRDKIEELARYASTKGVALYLWYNSNGYWNDAPQVRATS